MSIHVTLWNVRKEREGESERERARLNKKKCSHPSVVLHQLMRCYELWRREWGHIYAIISTFMNLIGKLTFINYQKNLQVRRTSITPHSIAKKGFQRMDGWDLTIWTRSMHPLQNGPFHAWNGNATKLISMMGSIFCILSPKWLTAKINKKNWVFHSMCIISIDGPFKNYNF